MSLKGCETLVDHASKMDHDCGLSKRILNSSPAGTGNQLQWRSLRIGVMNNYGQIEELPQ